MASGAPLLPDPLGMGDRDRDGDRELEVEMGIGAGPRKLRESLRPMMVPLFPPPGAG